MKNVRWSFRWVALWVGFFALMGAFATVMGGHLMAMHEIGGRVEILGDSLPVGAVVMGTGIVLIMPAFALALWRATQDLEDPREDSPSTTPE